MKKIPVLLLLFIGKIVLDKVILHNNKKQIF